MSRAPMDLLGLARTYGQRAREFNVFGLSNLMGYPYGLERANTTLKRFNEHRRGEDDSEFTADDKKILRAVIAQELNDAEVSPLMVDVAGSEDHLGRDERMSAKLKRYLQIAMYRAQNGSFNCEITSLVLALLTADRVTVPVHLVNFSGYWLDSTRDHQHSIVLLGGSLESFDVAARALVGDKTVSPSAMDGYVVCDAHHDEYYPLKEGFTKPGKRLARYHDTKFLGRSRDQDKAPVVRRLMFLDNPARYYAADAEIAPLCAEVLAQRGSTPGKLSVQSMYDTFTASSIAPAAVAATAGAGVASSSGALGRSGQNSQALFHAGSGGAAVASSGVSAAAPARAGAGAVEAEASSGESGEEREKLGMGSSAT